VLNSGYKHPRKLPEISSKQLQQLFLSFLSGRIQDWNNQLKASVEIANSKTKLGSIGKRLVPYEKSQSREAAQKKERRMANSHAPPY
jgi:hypothetical protein